MPFNRPPRLQAALPHDAVEIRAPASPPAKPAALNWITVALPLAAIGLVLLLTLSAAGSNGGNLNAPIFLPMMLAASLGTGLTYGWQRRQYAAALRQAKQAYAASLRQTEAELQSLQKRQQHILQETHPEPAECLRRTQTQDARLGERRPEDRDFLAVRLGLGTLPASFTVKLPDTFDPPAGFELEYRLAEMLAKTYSQTPEAPTLAHLASIGHLGLAGQRADVLGAARAIAGHIATHHWPGEVQIAAVSPSHPADWQWLRSLPHAAPALQRQGSTADEAGAPPPELMSALEAELLRREQLTESKKLAAANNAPAAPPLPRLVVIFDHLPNGYHHPALALLLRKGPELGAHSLFLVPEPRLVPGECGGVAVAQKGRLRYQTAGPEGAALECRPDELEAAPAEALARALAAIEWPASGDGAQPPPLVKFLEMFGAARVEALPLAEWWDRGNPYGHLRAPIGRTSATGDLIFNLNDADGAHGPHGLIGGMTGSGKSEVLKALLLALAVTHHPYDLNFALVDYKGGGAFNELARLPHTVGVVTNIETFASYAERVILALAGEIENRERILERARQAFAFGRSHVEEHRRLPVKRPLPHLVIVFDEFAEFKQRHPEESRRLISIARKGRSLGIHLILATQNIGAAVDPEILQNATFRLCLRVAEPQDSAQMIGIPDAVDLTRGRAYFRAQSRQLVQIAFSGAPYQPDASEAASSLGRSPRRVVRQWPDGRREAVPVSLSPEAADAAQGKPPVTEASAVVDYVVTLAQALRLKRPPKIWPDPLPERLYLPDVLARHVAGGWDGADWHPAQARPGGRHRPRPAHPILGLCDQPARQRQYPLQLDPDHGDGHLLVFGSAGSGKSTLLRALIVCLARLRRPDEAHVYALDFGGQSALKALEALPHVGAVVARAETERAERLIRFVHGEVARRNQLFRSLNVDTRLDYNAAVEPERRLPALYFVVDGFGEFKRDAPPEIVNGLAALVSGGLACGLYLILASSLPADIPPPLFANINLRLTFNQADQNEYFRIVGRPSESKIKEDASQPPPPGRGLMRGNPPLQFQAALPAEGESDLAQAAALAALVEKMRRAWQAREGRTPALILSLPLLVPLPEPGPDAPDGVGRRTPVGMLGQDFDTLDYVEFDLAQDGPTFVVMGTSPGSGKSTLLRAFLLDLAERYAPDEVRLVLIDFHTRALATFRDLPHTQAYAGSRAEAGQALARLKQEIEARQGAAGGWARVVVAIDDYESFHAKASDDTRLLADCLAQGAEVGCTFVVAGNQAELPRDFDDPFMQRVRKNRCGASLSGVEAVDQFMNIRRPPGQPAAGLPPGRGFLVRRGQARLFQAAAYWQDGESSAAALARRVNRIRRRGQPAGAGPALEDSGAGQR